MPGQRDEHSGGPRTHQDELTYRAGPPFWVVWLSIVLVVGLFVVVLVGSTKTGKYPITFLLFWGALSLILVVVYGLSWGARLRVQGDCLHWRAPMRARKVSLSDLEAVKLGRKRVAVFRTHDRRGLAVSTPSKSQDDFRAFVAGIRKRIPALTIDEW